MFCKVGIRRNKKKLATQLKSILSFSVLYVDHKGHSVHFFTSLL